MLFVNPAHQLPSFWSPAITTLCLVGCCQRKLRQAAPARELYCSPLFQLSRLWAERHADHWAILSAHYGVVRPDEMIAPYDTTLTSRRPFGGSPLTPKEFDGWLYSHVQAWRSQYVTPSGVPRLVVLAGHAYWRCLVDHGLEVSTPLDGLAIGQRLQWLKRQTAAGPAETPTRPAQPSLFGTADAP